MEAFELLLSCVDRRGHWRRSSLHCSPLTTQQLITQHGRQEGWPLHMASPVTIPALEVPLAVVPSREAAPMTWSGVVPLGVMAGGFLRRDLPPPMFFLLRERLVEVGDMG